MIEKLKSKFQISVDRLEILQIHSRNMPLDTDVDQNRIAAVTHGFVGADLEYLCKEAAMKCLRRVLPELNLEDEKAIARNTQQAD